MAKEKKKDAQLIKKRKVLDSHKKRKAEVRRGARRGFKGFQGRPPSPSPVPLWARSVVQTLSIHAKCNHLKQIYRIYASSSA